MDAVQRLILLRRGELWVAPSTPDADTAASLAAMEEALSALGFVLHRALRQALATLPGAALQPLGHAVRSALALHLGADVPHVPLIRSFPEQIPEDTHALYLVRILSYLLQRPEQPCLMCGTAGTVHAVKPCGHLVCRSCWDGAIWAGCPICHQRLDPDDPFVQPAAPRQGAEPGLALRLLHLGAPTQETAGALLTELLARATPLSPQDTDALDTLVDALERETLAHLPAEVPVRETLARVFGRLLRRSPDGRDALLEAAAERTQTATDVLRLFMAWSNDKADLIEITEKLRPAPRPWRRWVMARLEALPFHLMIEDVHRHAGLWKGLGRHLHAFDYIKTAPQACAAFAVLRRTPVNPEAPLGAALLAVAEAHPQVLRHEGGRLRWRGWAAQVERAFAEGRPDDALALLRQRPGELLRRLDHLLRSLAPERLPELREAVAEAAPKVSPQILLTVGAHLQRRDAPLRARVFLPKGGSLKPIVAPDTRAPLAPGIVERLTPLLYADLLRRAGAHPAFPVALLDAELRQLAVPFVERSAARALLTLPRGSRRPLPPGRVLRLFLHWMHGAYPRVDLDLSVGFFDAEWRPVNHVSFTNLRLGDAALHSGDLTSAPPPHGASEFVDLHVERLRAMGVRYAAFTVFSYSGQPFDTLQRAFAGVMARVDSERLRKEVHFDPTSVLQRYDLQGKAKFSLPMLVDLRDRALLWTDVSLKAAYDALTFEAYAAEVSELYRALYDSARMALRPTLWTLACLHAAARCREVRVRLAGGEQRYRRGDDEPVEAFFHRIHGEGEPDGWADEVQTLESPVFAASVEDTLRPPQGSEVYALRWQSTAPATVTRKEASDLLSLG